jgi:outer membrane lipoprotein-sorting protein
VIGFLRRISTRQLLALCAAVVAIAGGGAALALAATGGGPTPPPKDLPVAIHDALAAPQVQGVTARVEFTNHLVSTADVQGGSPLLSGASGRLWASSDGRLRLELQADASKGGGTSDAQLLSDGHQVTLFDSGTNTVYKADLPVGEMQDSGAPTKEQPPSVAEIQKQLTKVMEHASVSGAQPSDVAGHPAYTVRIEPRENGGLVGGAELAWDAIHGSPLLAAVYANGDSSPVIELKVTDISYGPVSSSVFDIAPPPGAKVTDLTKSSVAGEQNGGDQQGGKGEDAPVTGLDQVQKSVSFKLAAPDSLAGRSRNEVRLIHSGDQPAALVTYGKGLDAIAVVEQPAVAKPASSSSGDQGQVSLPTVSINGIQGEELQTPLGTLINFQRGGVGYTVIGSVSSATAQAAAQGL